MGFDCCRVIGIFRPLLCLLLCECTERVLRVFLEAPEIGGPSVAKRSGRFNRSRLKRSHIVVTLPMSSTSSPLSVLSSLHLKNHIGSLPEDAQVIWPTCCYKCESYPCFFSRFFEDVEISYISQLFPPCIAPCREARLSWLRTPTRLIKRCMKVSGSLPSLSSIGWDVGSSTSVPCAKQHTLV
jgi:hypothetical protein